MLTKGSIATVKEKKAHQLIPFAPGEPARVVSVTKFGSEKKRFLIESIDQSRSCELFAAHLRRVDMLEVDGRLRSIDEWAGDLGIKAAALKERIKYGWTNKEAVTTPKGQKPKATP